MLSHTNKYIVLYSLGRLIISIVGELLRTPSILAVELDDISALDVYLYISLCDDDY